MMVLTNIFLEFQHWLVFLVDKAQSHLLSPKDHCTEGWAEIETPNQGSWGHQV